VTLLKNVELPYYTASTQKVMHFIATALRIPDADIVIVVIQGGWEDEMGAGLGYQVN
jgi:hypothetical protein